MKISNFLQSGRSMVEMLGVLAIIGVLSVGGIAGYSKAMNKYKMNKFTVAMNELLNTSIQYTGQLYSSSNTTGAWGEQLFANILYKMNALPDGIKYYNSQSLKDMFGNIMWLFAYQSGTHGLAYVLSHNGSDTLNSEICHQLANIAKENSSQLWNIYTDHVTSPTTSQLHNQMYGDSYCVKAGNCIKNMTLEDIDTLCHSCISGSQCKFYFVWK